MYLTRYSLLATILSVVLFGGQVLADDECQLRVDYLLDSEDDLKFGISIDRCPGYWSLEFEEFGGRLENGDPLWNVLDTLEISRAAADEVIVAQTCSIGGVDDEGIVVIAQQTDKEWFERIRLAWRADREYGRWTSVDSRTVRCWNESAGL